MDPDDERHRCFCRQKVYPRKLVDDLPEYAISAMNKRFDELHKTMLNDPDAVIKMSMIAWFLNLKSDDE